MNVCVPSACLMLMEARKGVRYPQTGFEMVLCHYMEAGNLTQLLCNSKSKAFNRWAISPTPNLIFDDLVLLSHFSNSRPHLWWSRLALHYFLPVFFCLFFLQITLLSFVCYNLLIWGKSKCFRELCIWECSKINKGCVLCLFLLFYQVPGGDWPIIL